MPKMITMRALVAFDRNGKHVQVGDLFTAYPIEAASLRYKRKAAFSSGSMPAAPSPPSYGTRAMTAARPGEPPPLETPRDASTAPAQTAEAETTNTTDAGRSGRRSGRGQSYGTRNMGASKE
jgi:hypothetical protein